MKSRDSEKFNHDPWAEEYDADVQDETHPIRAGYGALLTWVADQCADKPNQSIVELGSGTGNLTKLLPEDAHVICVDTSKRMTEIAQQKLQGRKIEFEIGDILSYVTQDLKACDIVASTYALHHLTSDEKRVALSAMVRKLNPGGRIVIGDLMFENDASRAAIQKQLTDGGQQDVVTDIDDEHFWLLSRDLEQVFSDEIAVKHRQFSSLSWSLLISKRR